MPAKIVTRDDVIGLRRRTVKLSPHNKKWGALFEKEKELLIRRLDGLVTDIQHIGSTAIPGISAKPIIDMALGLSTLSDARKLIKPLTDLRYTWRKTAGSSRRWLFVKGPEEQRTHYLHVMRYNGDTWKRDVLFRDYLRANPAYAERYEKLKTALARKYGDNRGMYTKSKASFIRTTIELARKASLIKS